MKRHFIYLITLLMMILLINGCASDNKEDKPSSKIKLRQEMFATFSHGILAPDPEIRELSYNGKDITVQYNITNGEQDASFGLLIFVNGILQPYRVNENNTTMYKIKLSKNQKLTIPISFKPIQVSKNNDNTVNFLLMLNPSFYPEGEIKSFGHNHTISQLLPWKLVSNIESQNISSGSIIALENYKFTQIENNNTESAESNPPYNKSDIPLEMSINSNTAIVLDKDSDRCTIPLYISSRISGKYRVSIYINHKLIKAFDGYDYIDVDFKKDIAYKLLFNIDSSSHNKNVNESENFIYAMAVPVDYDYNNSDIEMVKSKTIILKSN